MAMSTDTRYAQLRDAAGRRGRRDVRPPSKGTGAEIVHVFPAPPREDGDPREQSNEWLRRYGLPVCAFSGIVFAALHVLFFLDTQSLSLVMAGMIMLLVSATRSSWFFLMDLQEK